MTTSDQMFRLEEDSIGTRTVPANAYYGVRTLRAVEVVPITGSRLATCPDLILALVDVKQAAAMSNYDLGRLSREQALAIASACKEVRLGALHDQFVADLIGGAAGTASNTNANEVLANRALELLGHQRGEYQFLHPEDHVNLGQQAEDVYSIAVKVAVIALMRRLSTDMTTLRGSFEAKALQFVHGAGGDGSPAEIGRSAPREQEFVAFARLLVDDEIQLVEAEVPIRAITPGGLVNETAGPPDLLEALCKRLSATTDIPLTLAGPRAATQHCRSLVHLSSVLKNLAVKLSFICDDLRRLSSEPGPHQLVLPRGDFGLPGHVRFAVPDLVSQIACEVMGNDVTISYATRSRYLEFGQLEPVVVYSLIRSLSRLQAACRTLNLNCIRGITLHPADLASAV